jgi:hypothetical protein
MRYDMLVSICLLRRLRMFVELVTSAVLEQAWHERSRIWQFTRDLLDVATKGKFQLYAFGPGGVGKTTFAKLLSGEYSLETVPPDYDLSLELEDHGVEGRHFVSVYVPPGQAIKRAYHWDDLYVQMQKAERYAIVNMVSWGYHSLAKIELPRHRLYRPGMSENEFMSLYLPESRDEEISVLKEILPHLKATPRKLRMLTLVAKQDLWWQQRYEVRNFYEGGMYNDLINELKAHKGAANFSHDYVSASFNLLNFRTYDGRVLQATESGYDLALWVANFNNVLKHIKVMIG